MAHKSETLERAVEARTEGEMQCSGERPNHTAAAAAFATIPNTLAGPRSTAARAHRQFTMSRIPVCTQTFGHDHIQSVDGRDLYAALESSDDFSTWMKSQIGRARLLDHRDFLVFRNSPEKGKQGRPRTDYYLTLESAKHIAMMSGTERGFAVREYFIECERQLRKPAPELSRLDLLSMALESERRALALETRQAQDAPKLAALDRLACSDGGVCITNAAKDLQMRPMDLFRFLRANGWIYRRPSGRGWLAYQPRLQQGLLEHKVTTIHRNDGSERVVENVLVTPKGMVRLAQLIGGAAQTEVFR